MKSYQAMPSRNLVNADQNAMQPTPRLQRSRFIGKKTLVTAFNASYIIPIHCEEMVPGDHMRFSIAPYVRLATPLFPLFSNQIIQVSAFACPMRLVWTNFERFMGAQDNPTDGINYTIPYVESANDGFAVSSLFDYLGVPTVGQVASGQKTRLYGLWHRMYNLVWNQWYRSENIQNSTIVDIDDGPDTYTDYVLLQVAKQHDMFTDALPWAQKFTAPTIPLAGGDLPVYGIGLSSATGSIPGPVAARETPSEQSTGGLRNYTNYRKSDDSPFWLAGDASDNIAVYAEIANLGFDVNTLRQAWLTQQLLELNARSGTRYTEIILSQFGVTVPDFRVQRTEYVGGANIPLNISPIAQTAPTTGLTVGALGAAAVADGRANFSYAAQEHTMLMVYLSVRSENAYQQGIPRHWARQTRYEFFTPPLANLGEQAIYRSEIYHTAYGSVNDTTVFGYRPAWDEMRQLYNTVTGIMRSTASGTISAWHLAQQFTAAPTLSDAFLKDDGVNILDRVLAAGSAPRAAGQQYLAEILIERDATRPIPIHGIPATLGRV